GCATPSPEQEAQIGAQMNWQMEHEAYLLHDRVIDAYLATIGAHIAAAAGLPVNSFRYQVVVDDEINAFAAPGGWIYVNTGTILTSRNAAELAGVMAHEAGHVAHRHVAQNVGRQRAANTARNIGVAAGAVAAGAAGASAANLLGGLASLAAL